MKRIRVVTLLGLGPRNVPFPYYSPVYYEDEGGTRTPHPVPLPFLQVLHALAGTEAVVSLVVLGTPEVRRRWIESGDLEKVLDQFLYAPMPFTFIEVPSGDPDADHPGEVSAAARFVQLLLPCLVRMALESEVESAWQMADEVVFDVTNGFRAQSVLSTTAIVAAVEEALRQDQEPALRVQYGAYDKRKGDVAPVWDLTGMVTQQAWVRAIDALVTSSRADAFELLCKDLAAERIGTNYRDRDRQREKQALRALGMAARTLADDIVCARTHSVLTSSAEKFCASLEEAGPLIARHAPAAETPLGQLAALVRPLACELVVSEEGVHAQLALAAACLKTERYAVATSILREVLVCAWHLETCGDRAAWQPDSEAASADWDWRAVEASLKNTDFVPPVHADPGRLERIRKVFHELGSLRNDVQHAGLRPRPLSSKQVREQTGKKLDACGRLIRDLYPRSGADFAQ